MLLTADIFFCLVILLTWRELNVKVIAPFLSVKIFCHKFFFFIIINNFNNNVINIIMRTRYFNLFSSMRVQPACRVTVEVKNAMICTHSISYDYLL